MSETVQQIFDEIAPRYDLLNRLLSLRMDRRWRREAVSFLIDCQNVLDLCAGTLDMSLDLLKLSPSTQIHAVDFSQDMLKQGLNKLDEKQKILEQINIKERLEYVIGLIEVEIDMIEVEQKVRGRVKDQMEKSQKEY